MFRKLLDWCAKATLPEAHPPISQHSCSAQDGWYDTWAFTIRCLVARDGNRSCEFIYQALAMHVCCQSLTLHQATELLLSTLGAYETLASAGKQPCLDCLRLGALRIEMRYRKRRLKVRHGDRRIQPSKN